MAGILNTVLLNEGQLIPKLATLAGSTEPVFILFMAAFNPDGVRWCPDCVVAEPVIAEAQTSIRAGATFLQVDIPRDRWRESPGKDHDFRKAPFNVSGIPALVHYDPNSKTVLSKLVESECAQLELVTSMLRMDEAA